MTELMKRPARIARVLHDDPATGVMRHADAGYEIAIDCAKEQGLNLPMIPATRGTACMNALTLTPGSLTLKQLRHVWRTAGDTLP